MKKVYFLIFLLCCFLSTAEAQFGYRELTKKQSSNDFYELKYKTVKDSVGTGYGFVNPVALKSIVFSKEKPTGEETKDWEVLDVKYAEIYRKMPVNEIQRILSERDLLDSVTAKKIHARAEYKTDTLKVYYLRNIKGNVAKGLNELVYETSSVRFFEAIESIHFAQHELVFFQTKERDSYDSDTYFLNYHSRKAFVRSAKRVFKDCPQIIEKISEGAYFPNIQQHLKELAHDYELFCATK